MEKVSDALSYIPRTATLGPGCELSACLPWCICTLCLSVMPLWSAWVWYHLNFEDCALSLTAGHPNTQWHLHAYPFLFNRCYSSVRYCLHQQILNYNISTWHLLKKPKSTKPLHSVWEGQLRLKGYWGLLSVAPLLNTACQLLPGNKEKCPSVCLDISHSKFGNWNVDSAWILSPRSKEHNFFLEPSFFLLPQFKFSMFSSCLFSWDIIFGVSTIMKFRSKMSARCFVGMRSRFYESQHIWIRWAASQLPDSTCFWVCATGQCYLLCGYGDVMCKLLMCIFLIIGQLAPYQELNLHM